MDNAANATNSGRIAAGGEGNSNMDVIHAQVRFQRGLSASMPSMLRPNVTTEIGPGRDAWDVSMETSRSCVGRGEEARTSDVLAQSLRCASRSLPNMSAADIERVLQAGLIHPQACMP